jgi:hypothetical protein
MVRSRPDFGAPLRRAAPRSFGARG